MDNFVVENLGPIAKAEVDFGDLTILTGPQASGKTLFLETFALNLNMLYIAYDFAKSNSIGDTDDFLDYYYGENLHNIIQDNTRFAFNNDNITKLQLLEEIRNKVNTCINDTYSFHFDAKLPNVFYIPAQRSLAVSEGRIKISDDFINSPYLLVKFSQYLQEYVKKNQTEILKDTIKDYDFFKAAKINMRRNAGSPRLEMTIDNQVIPYMAWSTGQRELASLLMAVDYLEKYTNRTYAIIEEPELGLHPRAIIEFMFTVLKLMKNGVKVIISTHSSTPLDFVWAMNRLKHKGAESYSALAEMFDFKIKEKDFFNGLFDKDIKVYYFAPDKKTRKVHSKDISSLDVESEDEDVSNWGGMSLSADRAGSIVSRF